MEIRELVESDAEEFYNCLKEIDNETYFMMYEPDERIYNKELILDEIKNKNNFLIGLIEQGKVVGFLSAERGIYRRIWHSAYIVVGIKQMYCNKGFGKELFKRLDVWAVQNSVTRLELTVECSNENAFKLYKKRGFAIEGLKKKSMFVNGQYVDEYMMAKIF